MLTKIQNQNFVCVCVLGMGAGQGETLHRRGGGGNSEVVDSEIMSRNPKPDPVLTLQRQEIMHML